MTPISVGDTVISYEGDALCEDAVSDIDGRYCWTEQYIWQLDISREGYDWWRKKEPVEPLGYSE